MTKPKRAMFECGNDQDACGFRGVVEIRYPKDDVATVSCPRCGLSEGWQPPASERAAIELLQWGEGTACPVCQGCYPLASPPLVGFQGHREWCWIDRMLKRRGTRRERR